MPFAILPKAETDDPKGRSMAETLTRTIRVKKEIPVPSTRDEFFAAQRNIAKLLRRIERRRARAAKAIQRIEEKATAENTPLLEAVMQLAEGCEAYFNANRDQLLPEGRKSVVLPTGAKIGTTTLPERMVVRNESEVLEEIRRRRLHGLTVTIVKVNGSALQRRKNDPKVRDMPGITIVPSGEQFVFIPSKRPERFVRNPNRGRLRIAKTEETIDL